MQLFSFTKNVAVLECEVIYKIFYIYNNMNIKHECIANFIINYVLFQKVLLIKWNDRGSEQAQFDIKSFIIAIILALLWVLKRTGLLEPTLLIRNVHMVLPQTSPNFQHAKFQTLRKKVDDKLFWFYPYQVFFHRTWESIKYSAFYTHPCMGYTKWNDISNHFLFKDSMIVWRVSNTVCGSFSWCLGYI